MYTYLHVTSLPKRRRGFAEKYVKRYLEKKGWRVLRGGLLHFGPHSEFSVVRNAYNTMLDCMNHPGFAQYMSFQRGMPDFVCRFGNRIMFVECKLEYEQLSRRQVVCIKRLVDFGFDVRVYVVCLHAKIRQAVVFGGEKKVTEKQLRMRLHW